MTYLLKLLILIIYRFESIGLGKGLRSGIYFILAYIIRYRSKVVDTNLSILFPAVTANELLQYKRKYYRHIADLLIETLWCFRASPLELKPKIEFKNLEIFDQIYQRRENATILLSHIGNWELFCQWAGLYIPKINVVVLYTPIKNNSLNEFMLKLRQRFGAYLVSTKSTLDLFRIQKAKKVCINLFAIDQNPGDPYNQHWLNFFGVCVPAISGAEKFAKSQAQKVYFLYVTKTNRYELELIELKYNADKPFDLTNKQFQILEKNILEDPSLWLLSHNRFKYKMED
jgi:KDO2-lipid IV(A) lauroyltransferase